MRVPRALNLRGVVDIQLSHCQGRVLRNHLPQVIRTEPAAAEFFKEHGHSHLGSAEIAVVVSKNRHIILVPLKNDPFVFRITGRLFDPHRRRLFGRPNQDVISLGAVDIVVSDFDNRPRDIVEMRLKDPQPQSVLYRSDPPVSQWWFWPSRSPR